MNDEKEQGLVYLAMELDDLDEVLDIERDSFRTPWTPDLFVREFENDLSRRRVVKNARGQVLAFLIYWLVVDEAHLMNVAVGPAWRGQGLGRLIMERFIAECRAKGACRISLEARRSNLTAIGLYDSLGFKAVGLRKNYYEDEHEDAVLMDLELA